MFWVSCVGGGGSGDLHSCVRCRFAGISTFGIDQVVIRPIGRIVADVTDPIMGIYRLRNRG